MRHGYKTGNHKVSQHWQITPEDLPREIIHKMMRYSWLFSDLRSSQWKRVWEVIKESQSREDLDFISVCGVFPMHEETGSFPGWGKNPKAASNTGISRVGEGCYRRSKGYVDLWHWRAQALHVVGRETSFQHRESNVSKVILPRAQVHMPFSSLLFTFSSMHQFHGPIWFQIESLSKSFK